MTDKKYSPAEMQRIEYMDYVLNTYCGREQRIAALESEISEVRARIDSGCVGTCDPSRVVSRTGDNSDSKHARALHNLCDREEELKKLRQEQAIVITAISRLSAYDRRLILLRYKDKFTYQQIAFQSGTSKDTVRREIKRILASM